MLLNTPKHRATLWILADVAWIAISPAAALYFGRQQRNGAYPLDADSIGLPIVGIALWVLVLSLPLNFFWWFLLRDYPGKVSLLTSGKEIKTGPVALGMLGLAFAISCFAASVWAIVGNAVEVVPVFLMWSYVTLAMRAAYLGAHSRPQAT